MMGCVCSVVDCSEEEEEEGGNWLTGVVVWGLLQWDTGLP